FRRLVRDLARDLDKKVDLVTLGEETELDKSVVESLADPLVHLIRNAIDHGIEPIAERIAAGKPEQGTLTLAADHLGGQVLITIADDGRGLDRERIRAKAEERGLLTPGADLAESELLGMIFQPGFSTATSVTDVSGRGVGLDVVRRGIDTLRGTVDVCSTPGEGSDIILRLPLTLAIIDGLLVRVGQGRYIVPLLAVDAIVELDRQGAEAAGSNHFLFIREELVPYLSLHALFSVTDSPSPYAKVVVVLQNERRVGLVVDQILGDHQTVIKSLSPLHADVACFSGATILGDGHVALILDITHLLDLGQRHEEKHRRAVESAA
ncbi:MAG: chemotaxis protein CheA, partial [Magnetococcales bacterium]|nr:chemotaxis protein CheA [Magnetococcales bacterium]